MTAFYIVSPFPNKLDGEEVLIHMETLVFMFLFGNQSKLNLIKIFYGYFVYWWYKTTPET